MSLVPVFKAIIVRASLVLLLIFAGTYPLQVHAQLGGGGGGQSPNDAAGSRPLSTNIDFFDLLESASEAFLEFFKTVPSNSPKKVKWNSNKTPRDTVMTFIAAMERYVQGDEAAFQRVRQTLPAGYQDNTEAATALLHVFDRLPKISPSTLPGEFSKSRSYVTSFELLPRGIDATFLYRTLSEKPAGTITLVKTKLENWTFASATLANAQQLLDSLDQLPPRPRIERSGQLFISIVKPTFTETTLLGWLKLVIVLLLTVLLIKYLAKAVNYLKGKLGKYSNIILTPLLTEKPVWLGIIMVAVGVMIATADIHLEPALAAMRWSFLRTMFILSAIWFLVSIVEISFSVLLEKMRQRRDPYARMIITLARQAIRIAAIIMLSLFVMQNVLHWNITAVLGGIGIFALALSLAAKDIVKNLLGTTMIFANRPFVINDWISFEDTIGKVEDVKLQVTLLRVLNGEMQAIPNMKFIDGTVTNLSLRRSIRSIFTVAVPYSLTADQIRSLIKSLEQVLTAEAEQVNKKLEQKPIVNFRRFGEYSQQLRIDYFYQMEEEAKSIQREEDRGWLSYLAHMTTVNLKIKTLFEKEGYDFAFPTQTIELANHNGLDPSSLAEDK